MDRNNNNNKVSSCMSGNLFKIVLVLACVIVSIYLFAQLGQSGRRHGKANQQFLGYFYLFFLFLFAIYIYIYIYHAF